MKHIVSLIPALLFIPGAALHAESFIVKDGKPLAEIVIADQPPRTVTIAANEMQTYVEKITGAKLPVKTQPSGGDVVSIYIGKSPHTDKLKLKDDDLLHGAFRMIASDKSLVLFGRDRDYTPREPWPRRATDMDRVMKEWDAMTGEHWGFDMNLKQAYKQFSKDVNVWEQDERGSLNAVHAFLHDLGVRWYLPGDIGEVVRKKASIALPVVDKVVRPDFPLRYPYQYGKRFGNSGGAEETLWQLRLGLNQAPDLIGPGYVAHGMVNVHSRDEVKKAHPEYYALIDGKRDTSEVGKPCLSSPELMAQNVKYVRTMFDKLDVPVVSVMPADGFTHMCQCELCKGKETPERGGFGRFSDYVWHYVNEVGKEVYKSHPDRKIICLAYGASVLPPQKIAKLSPNIIVCIAQGRAAFYEPERRQWIDELHKAWLDKLPTGSHQLCSYEYYLHPRAINPFAFMPVYFPHSIADDLRSTKGISLGDYIEVYRGVGLEAFSVNALNLYVTARMWWDSSLNVDALIDEYCRDLYGPASEEMKAFIAYSEAHWMEMGQSADVIGKTFELIGLAQKKVPADSPDGKRIAMVADYMHPLLAKREQLLRSAGRSEGRAMRVNDKDGKLIKIDGMLDEPLWSKMSGYQSTGLLDCATGKETKVRTRASFFWSDNSLYISLRCDDPDAQHLTATGTGRDDPHLLEGDNVQFLFETQSHSFYQIAVNPAGLVFDADHKDKAQPAWSSSAEIAATKDEKGWSVEMRLPVGGDLQDDVDALSGVSGRKPAATFPWFINVCRQRVRDGVIQRYAMSPTDKADFLDASKFRKLGGYAHPPTWDEEKKRRAAEKAAQ